MTDHIETTTLTPSPVNGEAVAAVDAPAVKPKRGRGRPRKTEAATKAPAGPVKLDESELATLGRLMLLASDAGMKPGEYIEKVVRPLLDVYTKTQEADRLIY